MFTSRKLRALLPMPNAQSGIKRWCVAFSGGMDSTVLLHALVELELSEPIHAIHVNHGLSPNAQAWEQHCKAECLSLNVTYTSVCVDVISQGKGLEDAARKARYQAFNENLREGDALLMGHHLDDQAETLLLRLLRGSGPRGLAAMAQERQLAQGVIYRPLLSISRLELEQYAVLEKLDWIEDESNSDERYDRNYLRHQVLPVLLKRWPDALTRFAQTARLCSSNEQLLDAKAQEQLALLEPRQEMLGVSLNWPLLHNFNVTERNQLIRYWLRIEHFSTPEEVHIAELERQFFLLDESKPAAEGAVEWGNVVLRVASERLYALPRKQMWSPDANLSTVLWENLKEPLLLPGEDRLQWLLSSEFGVGLALGWMNSNNAYVAWRQGGERCHPAGKAHSQKLKKLLQALQIPIWLRARVPVIYINGEIAAVGHYWVNQAFSAGLDEKGYTCAWQFPES